MVDRPSINIAPQDSCDNRSAPERPGNHVVESNPLMPSDGPASLPAVVARRCLRSEEACEHRPHLEGGIRSIRPIMAR